MGSFDGRTFLVTGAASGIGLASAQRLLHDGATVVGMDLSLPDVDHERFTTVVGDVGDDSAVAGAVDAAVAITGRLDGVMHAAGVAGGGPVHLLEPAEWDRVLRVNLTGTYLVCRHAVRQFLTQDVSGAGGRGAIVNVSSVEGIEGNRRGERV